MKSTKCAIGATVLTIVILFAIAAFGYIGFIYPIIIYVFLCTILAVCMFVLIARLWLAIYDHCIENKMG